MDDVLQKGATSQSIVVFLQDTTTFLGKTGLTFATGGLTAYYRRSGAAASAITLATQTVTGAWASGGFKEIDATNMPGLYRLDVPNAALATGVGQVVCQFNGASVHHEPHVITLTDYDPATVDPTIANIDAKTTNLPSDPADASVIAGLIAGVDTKIDTLDNLVDTEVAAIKAKTDQLTFTTAGAVDSKLVVTGMNNIVGYTP